MFGLLVPIALAGNKLILMFNTLLHILKYCLNYLYFTIGSWFVYPALTKNFKSSIGINTDVVDEGALVRQHLAKMRAEDKINPESEE